MKNKTFQGKSILIGIPNHFELPKRFKENLEYLGFEVFSLENTLQENIPLKDNIIHGFKKFFLGDKTHKSIIKNRLNEKKLIQYIENCKSVDYSFFIRPDLFSFKVIATAKRKSNKTIAYQWDGMSRYPLAIQYIDLFDEFYVFDKEDLKLSSKLKWTHNFYFDDVFPQKKHTKKTVFFVGTFMKDRLKPLMEISKHLKKNKLIPKFYLFSKKKRSTCDFECEIIHKEFSFKESIIKIQESEYILDLHNHIHHGLSFRTFESIGYEKKLITNNPLVKEWDFYHPNNIYLIGNKNITKLEQFIKAPYLKIEKEIYEKYGFTTWIKEILNDRPN